MFDFIHVLCSAQSVILSVPLWYPTKRTTFTMNAAATGIDEGSATTRYGRGKRIGEETADEMMKFGFNHSTDRMVSTVALLITGS
jgi:hypothetical protein